MSPLEIMGERLTYWIAAWRFHGVVGADTRQLTAAALVAARSPWTPSVLSSLGLPLQAAMMTGAFRPGRLLASTAFAKGGNPPLDRCLH